MTVGLLASVTSAPPAWRVLAGFGFFVGLCGAIGFGLTYRLAVAPGGRAVPGGRALLVAAGVVAVVTDYAQLAARVARAGAPYAAALNPAAIARFLGRPAGPGEWVSKGTLFAVAHLVLLVAGLLLVALCAGPVASRAAAVTGTAGPLAVLANLVIGVPTSALSVDGWVDRVANQAHIVAGTAWLGGVTLLALLAVRTRRSARGAELAWAGIWQRFSVLAMVAVGVVICTGLWLTWRHVGSVGQLFTTRFGQFLLVKLLLVLGVVAAGAFNQLWLMPRMARARAAGAPVGTFALRRFPAVVTVEALLGLGVLMVVPFLTGSARAQAGGAASPPAADAGVLAAAVVLVATLVGSFVVTARTSTALGRGHWSGP